MKVILGTLSGALKSALKNKNTDAPSFHIVKLQYFQTLKARNSVNVHCCWMNLYSGADKYIPNAELQIRCVKWTWIDFTCVTSSSTLLFDHLLESSQWDISNKWSNIGFSEEITQVLSIKVNCTHLIWSFGLKILCMQRDNNHQRQTRQWHLDQDLWKNAEMSPELTADPSFLTVARLAACLAVIFWWHMTHNVRRLSMSHWPPPSHTGLMWSTCQNWNSFRYM